MKLDIQIYSLIYSLLFGVALYFLIAIFDRSTIKSKLIMKIILTLIFTLTLAIAYFWGLLYINNGYLHLYFFVLIMVGYILAYFIKTKWFTLWRRK